MRVKRIFLTLYILSALVPLSGCRVGGNIFSSHRDMERLRPVQTVGVDREAGRFLVSVSTGSGIDSSPPLVMSAPGTRIENAINVLQDHSPEDELFYAHVRYLLLGQSMTGESLQSLLDWVERSPAMRMETPLLLIRGEAAEAQASSAGQTSDITERLTSLEREEHTWGRHIYTLRETAASLEERGCALCLSVRSQPGTGTVLSSGEAGTAALIPAGYAVLRRDGPALLLTEGESLGAELLTTGVSGARVTAGGCVLDLIRGSAELCPRRDGSGGITDFEIRCTLRAGLLDGPPGSEEEAGRALTLAAEGWLRETLRRAVGSGCDFPGFRDAAGADWAALLARLPVAYLVDAQIDQSYDLDREAA